MAFGLKKKNQVGFFNGTLVMNAPFAFVLGKDFKTNRALLRFLSMDSATIHLSMDGEVPNLINYFDIPMSFRLPGDQNIWKCNIDVVRLYAYDEHDRPVYGMVLRFKNFTKEQLEQIQHYLQARKNAGAPVANNQ
jgi:hypothetical protein